MYSSHCQLGSNYGLVIAALLPNIGGTFNRRVADYMSRLWLRHMVCRFHPPSFPEDSDVKFGWLDMNNDNANDWRKNTISIRYYIEAGDEGHQ